MRAFLTLFLSLCAIIGSGFYFLLVPTMNDQTYFLRPGMTKKQVIADLSQQNIIKYPVLFSFYIYAQPIKVLKSGEYFFKKGSTGISVWKQITQGTGFFYHAFTIVPGWSFTQLRYALLQANDLQHLTEKLNDKQIMSYLNSPFLPEGEFYPETYYYTKGTSDLVILKRAFDYMQNKLNEAWQTRAPELPYQNSYEALIAASLIEKEAYLAIERPMIAGVLVNRLRKDMLLQFDPAVIYGMGARYQGKISKENLLENTPYNTYVHKGLPPTPIALPSMASLQAVMHPEVSDYYYFVAKGDGGHQFSKTLLEHNAAVFTAITRQSGYFNETRVKQMVYRVMMTRNTNNGAS